MEWFSNEKKLNNFFSLSILLFIFLVLQVSCSKKGSTHQQMKETSISVSEHQKNIPVNKKIAEAYKKNTKKFIQINPENLKNIVNEKRNKDIFVYFGRLSCPYCRNFVSLLTKEKPSNLDIYYIDTEDTDENLQIKKVRTEYEIDSVPSFIKITKNTFIKFNIEDGNFSNFFGI